MFLCRASEKKQTRIAAVPNSSVDTHLEPIEDPVSWQDLRLERAD